jgi:AcrR family transcriptional regulator
MMSPRDRLWSAAIDEFATHGREGARVDRIAAASSLNKQRIYQYCPEGKDGLFAECVRQILEDAEKKVPLPDSMSDIVRYAEDLYDFFQKDKRVRILQWEELDIASPARRFRIEFHARRAHRIHDIFPDELRGQADNVIFAISALCIWPSFGIRISGALLEHKVMEGGYRDFLLKLVSSICDPEGHLWC